MKRSSALQERSCLIPSNSHLTEHTPLLSQPPEAKGSPFCFPKIMEKIRNTKVSKFFDKIAVESEPGLTNAQLMLLNEDLKPVEPERRLWRSRNFVAFWISDSFNINTWMISSSNILDGLSWWQSWLCVWIGYSIAACFVCLTGRIGAKYHISFPVVCRSSFGIWDGANNSMPSSSGTNTRDFVSFFLFWAGSLPFLWFPVQKIRHLFTAKAYFVPVAGILFFIWAIVRANGIGPIVHQGSTIGGSKLAWAIVKGIMSAIANFATLIVNDPDFARFARRPRDALWAQLFTIPVGFAVTSFIGIIVSSSSTVIFKGDPIWSPLTLLEKFLNEPTASGATRFGVFVIAAAFTLAQLGTNIAANSISAGTDMTALLPRWINIRRGSYICAAVGLAMCPWNLLKDSNNFTTYLSAYSVFLSSIAGVMCCDYYCVRKGYLQTRDLYSALKNGPYYYHFGVSWRAYAAYIAGILINVVGFAGAVGTPVPVGATYVYNLNFFGGFGVAGIVYYLLCRIWPVPACSDSWMEVDEDATGRNNSMVYGVEPSDDEAQYGETVYGGKGAEIPKATAV
ncbi:Uracil permease, partial [Pseudocercospora fuligena]